MDFYIGWRPPARPSSARCPRQAAGEVDPADVLAPGQAREGVGGGVAIDAEVQAGRVGVGAGAVAEVDPADVLAPGEAAEVVGFQAHALGAGGAAGVGPVEPAAV